MALFSRTVDNDSWQAAALGFVGSLEELLRPLIEPAFSIRDDPLRGWALHTQVIAKFGDAEREFKRIEAAYKQIGKPTDERLKSAMKALNECCTQCSMAFHWGKVHFKDAPGGPGDRARTETGMVGRAAVLRVTNNGVGFATAVVQAVMAARSARELLSPGRPSLRDLLVAGLDAAEPSQDRQGPHYMFAQAAMVAAYIFEQATLLGTELRSIGEDATELVWRRDGRRTLSEAFAEKRTAWSSALAQRRDADAELEATPSSYYLALEFPEAYAPGAAFLNPQDFNKRLEQRLSVEDAGMLWSEAAAWGLALGLYAPEEADRLLEYRFKPRDREKWSQAVADGLDIPAEPPEEDRSETVSNLLEGVGALASEYYPDLATRLAEISRPRS